MPEQSNTDNNIALKGQPLLLVNELIPEFGAATKRYNFIFSDHNMRYIKGCAVPRFCGSAVLRFCGSGDGQLKVMGQWGSSMKYRFFWWLCRGSALLWIRFH